MNLQNPNNQAILNHTKVVSRMIGIAGFAIWSLMMLMAPDGRYNGQDFIISVFGGITCWSLSYIAIYLALLVAQPQGDKVSRKQQILDHRLPPPEPEKRKMLIDFGLPTGKSSALTYQNGITRNHMEQLARFLLAEDAPEFLSQRKLDKANIASRFAEVPPSAADIMEWLEKNKLIEPHGNGGLYKITDKLKSALHHYGNGAGMHTSASSTATIHRSELWPVPPATTEAQQT